MKYGIIIGLIIVIIVLFGCQPERKCDSLSDPVMKDECYLENAINSSNDALCQSIENKGMKHECFTMIGIKTLNADLCSQTDFSADFCLQEIAVKANNPEGCQTIKDSEWKSFCFRNIAQNFNRYELCFNVTNNEESDECFYHTAINFSNEQICEKISMHMICVSEGNCYFGNELKDKCYRHLSIKKNELSLCDKARDIIINSYCYRDHAVLNKNPKICELIRYGPIKQSCIKSASLTV